MHNIHKSTILGGLRRLSLAMHNIIILCIVHSTTTCLSSSMHNIICILAYAYQELVLDYSMDTLARVVVLEYAYTCTHTLLLLKYVCILASICIHITYYAYQRLVQAGRTCTSQYAYPRAMHTTMHRVLHSRSIMSYTRVICTVPSMHNIMDTTRVCIRFVLQQYAYNYAYVHMHTLEQQ